MARLSKVKRILWSAFLDEAKANRLYTAYARRAMEEGHPEIAEIFQKVAEAETRHALSHLGALNEVKSTAENLSSVLELERYEAEEVFPRMLAQVRTSGNKAAIESLEMAIREGGDHLREFERALGLLKAKGLASPARAKPKKSAGAPKPRNAEVRGEKLRIAGLERIRELVFGLQDGIVSTVGVTSSVMIATGQTFPTLTAGLAGGIAGTIAMASGSYLASKSETELHAAEIAQENRELVERPEEEVAELVDLYREEGFSYEEAAELADRVALDPRLLLKTLAEKELGLAPEAAQAESPLKDALTMGAAFLLGSGLSLFPYLLLTGTAAVKISVAASLLGLFLVGAAKTKVTHRSPWTSGAEALLLGAFSAILGCALGSVLPGLSLK